MLKITMSYTYSNSRTFTVDLEKEDGTINDATTLLSNFVAKMKDMNLDSPSNIISDKVNIKSGYNSKKHFSYIDHTDGVSHAEGSSSKYK